MRQAGHVNAPLRYIYSSVRVSLPQLTAKGLKLLEAYLVICSIFWPRKFQLNTELVKENL